MQNASLSSYYLIFLLKKGWRKDDDNIVDEFLFDIDNSINYRLLKSEFDNGIFILSVIEKVIDNMLDVWNFFLKLISVVFGHQKKPSKSTKKWACI